MLIGIGATAYHRQNILAQILGGAEVWLPITHTAVPQRGSITPTFTRATTETGQKWDEAGYLDFTALAGEIVFKGARRVRNLLTFTEDFSNAAWTKLNNGTGVLPVVTPNYAEAPDGTTTACRVQLSAGGGTTSSDYSIVRQTSADQGTLRSVYVKSLTSSVDVDLRFSTAGNRVTVTTEWTRVAGALYTLDGIFDIAIDGSYSASADILIWHPQLEDVTGQTTQTASEYVSVGVESAPAYHGSMVDGVKCYATDRSGNPISTSGSYPLVGYVPWEARTNLCLQSEDFSTTWTNNNTTESVNAVVAPNGTTTADKLVEAATNTTHTIYNTIAGTSGVYTSSVYLKAAERTWAYLTEGNSVTATAYFDLINGVVGTVSGTGSPSARIVDAGNGWYRCSMTFTAGANANIQIGTSTGDTNTSFLGDIAKGVYVYGAQLELGSFATPYIPTTTVAAARNANLLTYTGADVANIKTLAVEVTPRAAGVNDVFIVASLSGAAPNKQIYFDKESALAYGSLYVRDTTDQAFVNIGTYTAGVKTKVAGRFSTNNFAGCINGGTVGTDTSGTKPAVTQLNVGTDIAASVFINSPVGPLYGWTSRELSDSELQAITA